MKDPWAQVTSAARKKLLWGRFVSILFPTERFLSEFTEFVFQP